MERIAGRYVLVRRLGGDAASAASAASDGAAVYLGRDEALDRPVVVKVLNPHLAASEVRSRFRRAGRAAARLSHPNVAQVYGVEGASFDGRKTSCIVMEHVPGGDLKDLMDRNGPLPWTMLSRIGADVAAALAHAHGRGVVHRDVKPRNILLDRYGSPKLTDFGIARALGKLPNSTGAGSYAGAATALYSSPEQLNGGRVTPKSDVYSLGATLYHAAVGEPPFSGDPAEVAGRQMERSPVPPRKRGASIGTRFEALILSCLSRNPASRPDASHLHERLLQVGAAADGATARPDASNGAVGAAAAEAALKNAQNPRAAKTARLSRATGVAKTAGLAGFAGLAGLAGLTRTRDAGRRSDGREGEKPGGPPGMTTTVPTGSSPSGPHRRNGLAFLAAALVLLLLLGGGAWALMGPGEEEAANPPDAPRADGGRQNDGSDRQAPARRESGGGANANPSGGDADPSGASNRTSKGAAGGTQSEEVPPAAEAEKLVYGMYVDQSYGRVDATWDALSERLQGKVGSPERWAEQEDLYTFVYMQYVSNPTATVSGDTARVAFQAQLDHTWGSEMLSGTWVCVVEDGKWKLDRLEDETVEPV